MERNERISLRWLAHVEGPSLSTHVLSTMCCLGKL
jgi:hypothetical protein